RRHRRAYGLHAGRHGPDRRHRLRMAWPRLPQARLVQPRLSLDRRASGDRVDSYNLRAAHRAFEEQPINAGRRCRFQPLQAFQTFHIWGGMVGNKTSARAVRHKSSGQPPYTISFSGKDATRLQSMAREGRTGRLVIEVRPNSKAQIREIVDEI